MSGHRRGTGKPKAPVARVRRRFAHAMARVQRAGEQAPAAALDVVRRELAAMDPGEAARRRQVLTEVLLAHAKSAFETNERCAP